jgi:DNA recombination protein RmuC
MAQSAREISDLGRELHQRLGTFAGHVQKLGSRLATAVGAYNEAVGSLESRVLPQARRFSEHGAVAEDQDIPALQPVAASPRALAAPELVDDEGEIAVRQLRDAS